MSKFEQLGKFIRSSLERITSSEASHELSPIVRANLSILRVVESSLTQAGAVSRKDYEQGSSFNLSQLNDGAVFRVHYTPKDNQSISFWRYAVQIHEPDRRAGGLFSPTSVLVSNSTQLLLPKAQDSKSIDAIRDNLSTHELLEKSEPIYPDLRWDDPLRTFPQEFFIDVSTHQRLYMVKVLQIQLVDSGHALLIPQRANTQVNESPLSSYQPITA